MIAPNVPRPLWIALIVGVLALAACSPDHVNRKNAPLLANASGDVTRDARSGTDALRWQLGGPAPDRRVLGTDEFMANSSGPRDLVHVSDDGAITLNLIDVPIEVAAKAVLGDALQKNYTIKPGVEGTVTLQTTRPLTERALLDTFQTILEFNGAALQVSGELITIVPLRGAAQRITRASALGIGTRVVAVPLQYIGTAEMQRLLEPIAGESVRLQILPKRNIILISGTREEINAVIDAVNLFDVDVLKGKSVGLYRLKAAEPEAVAQELDLIFESGEGGSLQNVVTIIPSTRLSAVIVVSSRAKYLSKAERWIRDLDKTAGGAKRRPAVYNLQHRSAEELAPILAKMVEEVAHEDGTLVESQPRVVADDTKNAIVIWGNDSEQENFARLIRTLDTVPVQVLLEATIAEVTLNDELNFGLRWFFESGKLGGTFSDASNGAVASTFPGLSFLFQGSSARVALNALATVTDVNVVSSPLTCHGIFPPTSIRVRPNLRTDNEANKIYGRADHRHSDGARGWGEVRRPLPQARYVGRHILQLEGQIRRHDGVGCEAAEGTGR